MQLLGPLEQGRVLDVVCGESAPNLPHHSLITPLTSLGVVPDLTKVMAHVAQRVILGRVELVLDLLEGERMLDRLVVIWELALSG